MIIELILNYLLMTQGSLLGLRLIHRYYDVISSNYNLLAKRTNEIDRIEPSENNHYGKIKLNTYLLFKHINL